MRGVYDCNYQYLIYDVGDSLPDINQGSISFPEDNKLILLWKMNAIFKNDKGSSAPYVFSLLKYLNSD
jgi:hypothetical protein